MKILIIRGGGLDEILLATPLIRCIKKELHGSEIHFLLSNEFPHLLEGNPYITTIHNDTDLTPERIEEEKFDVVVDLDHFTLTRDGVVANPKVSFVERLLRLVGMKQSTPLIDKYCKVVTQMNVYSDGEGLNYYIPKAGEVPIGDIPASHHGGYIVLAVSGSASKIALAKGKEFCSKINHPVILMGKRAEFSLGEELRRGLAEKVYNACGKFSFTEEADMIRRAKLVVGVYSELIQFAAAFNVPSIVVGKMPEGLKPYYGEKIVQKQPNIFEHINRQPAKMDVDAIIKKVYERIRKKS